MVKVLLFVVGLLSAQAGVLAPKRIVSLDYCADQYVLQFVASSNIAALSLDATQSFSYLRAEAAGLPTIRATAEDIITARPDLVIRSYGGGARIGPFLESLGIPVLQIGTAQNLSDIKENVLTIATALGNGAAGRQIVSRMDERLQRIAQAKANSIGEAGPNVMYMTPTGVTSGPATLIHELIVAAGLTNYQDRAGWHPLPLERLVYDSPQVVALAFYESLTSPANAWSAGPSSSSSASNRLIPSRTVAGRVGLPVVVGLL